MAIPVISVERMRAWEQATWDTGTSAASVIEQAGAALASRLRELTRPGARLLFLCGKGNNGADAKAAAALLPDREAEVVDVDGPGARAALKARLMEDLDWIVDGLFGIGLDRELSAEWSDLIDEINRSKHSVLAVDAPSGFHADLGRPMPTAMEASETVTFGAPKRGLLSGEAAKYVGRLTLASEIGLLPLDSEEFLLPETIEAEWVTEADFRRFPPRRRSRSHKGTFGRLQIYAGSLGYAGAAVIAAKGALRARPGIVSLITSKNIFPLVAAQVPQALCFPSEREEEEPRPTAYLIGPGLAARDSSISGLKKKAIAAWKFAACPVVADASALDWLPESSSDPVGLRVITPHPGEAARLLGTDVASVEKDRFEAVRALSRKFGRVYVVLKGRQTLVGRCDGVIGVNSSGNPGLAQGGTGDALAGLIAGLLAQPGVLSVADQAIRYAVWFHGACADRLSDRYGAWDVEDLLEMMKAPCG